MSATPSPSKGSDPAPDSPRRPRANEDRQLSQSRDPVSRLISSSANVPSRQHSSSPSFRPPSSKRQSSTTSSAPSRHSSIGSKLAGKRPSNARSSSSATSTRRKPRPQNVAGPPATINRFESERGSASYVSAGRNGGGTGGESSASGGGSNEKPLWAMGGVFPQKARRGSNVAQGGARNSERKRKDSSASEFRGGRTGREGTSSIGSEPPSISRKRRNAATQLGDEDPETIVERADPFEQYGSGDDTDHSDNTQTSDRSRMSKGGSTANHPVKRQDQEEVNRRNEMPRDASEQDPIEEKAEQLNRPISPDTSASAQREREREADYTDKFEKGRGEVEDDSVEQHRKDREEEDAYDARSRTSGRSSGSGAGDDTPQVGGQLNQNGDEWQDDMAAQEGPPIRNLWGTIRYALREPMAEFLGTMILVVLGIGADCQTKISGNNAGDFSSQNWTWGFAVMTSVYVAGGISGGHTNPAVTVSLAVFRGFPWKMVPRYILAQILGAFVGALMIYGNYKRAIHQYDPYKRIHAQEYPPLNASGTLFFTAPAVSVGTTPLGFAQEILAGGVLMIAVLALGDENNAPPGAGLGAIVLGFVVVAIGMSNGFISGYAINPARDLGPRFALWAVGYGTKVWTHDNCWWIFGPLLGPLVGSIAGCLAYDLLIFTGPGSPVNWSTYELAASVGLPQMYRLMRRAAHPKSRHTQAEYEHDLEATLPQAVSVMGRAEMSRQDRPGRQGSTERKDLEVVQRWRMGKARVDRQQETNREKYEAVKRRNLAQMKQDAQARLDAIDGAHEAQENNEEALDTSKEGSNS
ncbi:uncharacterized protein JCM15063_001532 [Sporobolomyces koalae]|uniref:uncharacterized protein n=1 Tax=Sporobolomyces koalae TaxID=500713 RepID=UPI0031796F8C